jgi:hypothetical protein
MGQSFVLGQRRTIMGQKYSVQYIDDLYARADFSALVQLSSDIYGWDGFRRDEPECGFPSAIFGFLETLTWSSRSIRSGVWTYYESTPLSRQWAMLAIAASIAPAELAAAYRLGMATWRDTAAVAAVDRWIAQNEDLITEWHWRILREHREQVNRLL